jgi:hypothetical protein
VSEIAPQPVPAPRRPAVVTAAGYLMIAVAVLGLVIAVLPLPYAGHVSAVAKQAYAHVNNGAAIASAVSAVTYITLVVYLIAGGALAVLAVFNLRGNNGTRIATWVVGGIGVLCCGSGVLIGRLATIGRNTGDPAMQAAQNQVQAAYPSWYAGVSTTLTTLGLLALVAVIVLLALPTSNEYFRRGRAVAAPGLPPLPYPQVGQPLPPYPPVGGEPPVPPPPGPPTQRDQ